MARSAYIYLVIEEGEPVAAFTVKHEMESWLDHRPGTFKRFRMRDGLRAADEKSPVEMT